MSSIPSHDERTGICVFGICGGMTTNGSDGPSTLAGCGTTRVVVVANVTWLVGNGGKGGGDGVASCRTTVRRDRNGTLVGADRISGMVGKIRSLNRRTAGII